MTLASGADRLVVKIVTTYTEPRRGCREDGDVPLVTTAEEGGAGGGPFLPRLTGWHARRVTVGQMRH